MTERKQHGANTEGTGSGGYHRRVSRAAVFVAVALFVCVLTVGFSGTAAAQQEISNVSELNDIRNDLGGDYVLVDDVDLSGVSNFDPIAPGGVGQRFTGTLDGQGYSITGLTIDRPTEDQVGLFGVLDGGNVENLTLRNVDVTAGNNAGALVGQGIGGASGPAERIRDVSVNGTVSGNDSTGGIIGDLASGGAVRGSSTNVTVSGEAAVGGVVGDIGDGTVSESHASGDLEGTERGVGGLVGTNAGTIKRSFATGDITSSTDTGTGGLVGFNPDGTILDSYARGKVTGVDSVGGLVGQNGFVNDGIVKRSYATGNVTGTDDFTVSFAGGLTGQNSSGRVTNSYWDTQSTTQSTSGGGTPLTTAEMTGNAAPGNMSGFDFTLVWETVTSPDDYPVLNPVPILEVSITNTNSPVIEGETLEVTADFTNTGGGRATQDVNLTDTGFTNEQQDETEVSLGPGESDSSVILEWQTDGGDIRTGDVTVSSENDSDTRSVTVEPEPAFFDVNITGTNSPVEKGEVLNVTANVTNTGNRTDTQGVGLNDTDFGDKKQDETDVTLAPGESNDSIVLQWQTDASDVGTGDVTVSSENDSDSGTVTVEQGVFFKADVTGTNSPVIEGETLEVTANVTNTGDKEGTQEVNLTDTGFTNEQQDTAELTLAPGESNDSVVLEWQTDGGDIGTGDVTVSSENDSDTRSVTVEPEPAFFDVNITGTNSPVIEGETLEVTANVTNTGNRTDTQGVGLNDTDFSDKKQDETDVTLNPGESNDSVVLEWQTEVGDTGTGDVTVSSENDSDSESVTVGRQAESELSNLDIAGQGGNATITEGENEAVAVEIKNIGDEDGSFNVTLEIGDGVRENESVESLSGGGMETVAFSGVTGALGPADYAVNVSTANDTVTGDLTVEEDDCVRRRSVSRGQEDQECPPTAI